MLDNRITAGQLSAFVFYAVLVAAGAGALAEVLGELQRAAGALERILNILALQPRVVRPVKPLQLPKKGKGYLRLETISFAYPGCSRNIDRYRFFDCARGNSRISRALRSR